MPEQLLKLDRVLEMVGFGQATVRRWVAEGRFPQPVRVQGRAVRWVRSEVLQWIQDQVTQDREVA